MYAAAKAINIKYSTIKYYVNKDKLLKGTYLITSKPKISKREGCHRQGTEFAKLRMKMLKSSILFLSD